MRVRTFDQNRQRSCRSRAISAQSLAEYQTLLRANINFLVELGVINRLIATFATEERAATAVAAAAALQAAQEAELAAQAANAPPAEQGAGQLAEAPQPAEPEMEGRAMDLEAADGGL